MCARRRCALLAATAAAVLLAVSMAPSPGAGSQPAAGCSEALCGPRVSKCILLKSCNCTMAPLPTAGSNGNGSAAAACPCCKQCARCLADYYSDCCACVGLCRPSKPVDASQLMRSLVDDLHGDEGQRALFDMLTDDEGGDEDAEWTVHTFPTLSGAGGKLPHKEEGETSLAGPPLGQLAGLNCTVAFVKRCLSLDKCRKACQSMGAASYRWFHAGCCECVGYTCIDYGWRAALCALCDEEGGAHGKPVPTGRRDGEL